MILGNPPYCGYAGISNMAEERSLAKAYREPEPGTEPVRLPEGQGLNDLYVRFFRMAERKIAEWTKEGVVCFISNYSWLDGLSHPLMRQAYLQQFDRLWIDSLNGDNYSTGKVTPEGEPDPSIFSTPQNREGIQVGTGISLMVRKADHQPARTVAYRDVWGKDKLAQLDRVATGPAPVYPHALDPHPALGLPFRPVKVSEAYLSWPTLEEVFPVSFPGVKTSRDAFLVDIDRGRLDARLAHYFDPALSHAAMKIQHPEIMTPGARFQPEAVRDTLRKRGMSLDGVVRYAYRPMDVRWLYWEGETDLLDRPRLDYQPQVFEGNLFVECRKKISNDVFDRGCVFRSLGDQMGNGTTSYFPMLLRAHHEDGALYAADERPNLSPLALAKLAELNGSAITVHHRSSPAKMLLKTGDERRLTVMKDSEEPLATGADSTALFFHALAILHAPAYREENAGALRMDWPRIPWPLSMATLAASAKLGRQVAALLDVEQPVPKVTAGKIPEDLRKVAVLTVVDGSPLNPALDLELTAGWGIRGQGGIVMPSEGRREGTRVFLNDRACWDGLSDAVWQYSLGGYQVLKKWLSYRDSRLLGRALSPDEAAHFTHMARRIAALLALGMELDANYRTLA